MHISVWISDVCSSDLVFAVIARGVAEQQPVQAESKAVLAPAAHAQRLAMGLVLPPGDAGRGEPVVDAVQVGIGQVERGHHLRHREQVPYFRGRASRVSQSEARKSTRLNSSN